jgi:hypothetical protein
MVSSKISFTYMNLQTLSFIGTSNLKIMHESKIIVEISSIFQEFPYVIEAYGSFIQYYCSQYKGFNDIGKGIN